MISDYNKLYIWKCDKEYMEVLKLKEWDLN